MTKSIYILTVMGEHTSKPSHYTISPARYVVTEVINGHYGLFQYADALLSCSHHPVRRSDSIEEILYKLGDNGPGHGARYHCRISRKEAISLIKSGARDSTFLFCGE